MNGNRFIILRVQTYREALCRLPVSMTTPILADGGGNAFNAHYSCPLLPAVAQVRQDYLAVTVTL